MSEPHETENVEKRGDPLGPISLLNRKLGQYILGEPLGRGGMGLVFRAQDTALERTVAVKVLNCSALEDQKQSARFTREARTLARLKHPNLVHVYNVGSESGCHYFAMELLEGETLHAAIKRRGRLPADELLPYLAQILSALDHVHKHGIVHRDIKSGNMMLCGRRAVLMDLGLAKDENQSGLTSEGSVLGTPDYMAPESANGESAGPATDIYSLGVVMYEGLSGSVPFTGRSAMAIIRQHLDTPPPPLLARVPELDSALVAIIERCLAKDAAERYADCSALARDLMHVCGAPELAGLASGQTEMKTLHDGEIGVPGPTLAMSPAFVPTVKAPLTPPTHVPHKTVVKRAPPWRWIAAGLAACALIFVLFAAFRHPEPPLPRQWAGQTVRMRKPDGTAGDSLRWLRFENSADPGQRALVVSRQQPDGSWKEERLAPKDLLNGGDSAVLEFVPDADAKGKP